MAKQTKSKTKVITGKVRFSYLNVFEPRAIDENAEAKYSASIIIPKSDKKTIKAIQEAIQEALEEGKEKKFGGKTPSNFKNPLRDGDEDREDDEAYADCYFVNANSARQPGLVDESVQAIIDQDEIYSGCYGRASLNFYAYNVSGNKGVAVGLNNIQKLEDGEPLGGTRATAESDFGDDDDLL